MHNKSVLIFRKKLLAYSETFIADQGRYLPQYMPFYCGFDSDSSGLGLLPDSKVILLNKYAKHKNLAKILFRAGRFNHQWLSEIDAVSPAIIHAHFLNDGIDALKLGQKLEVPLITTLHGHDITKPEKKSWLKCGRKAFFDRVDRVIAVSDYIYAQALENGCPEQKLLKHSIGIDLQKFSSEKHETGNPSLLFVGRLVEKKGCIYLLQALRILQKKNPDISLTIVGNGPLEDELRQYVTDHRLNVAFVGRESAEQIRQRLSQAWVFVAPSITAENGDAEGLGMVFLEAQALKTPVVSYASGGVVEAVEDGVSGLLLKEKDIDGLAEKIAYLIENGTLRQKYGQNGRSRVEKLFDIRQQCVILERIYEGVQ